MTGSVVQERLGWAVRTLRARAGYSQESFADAIHLHRTSMGTVERGEGNPTLKTVVRIAQGLEMSLGELFTVMDEGGR
jgi:DNA-binding XRE family transcriptional regulator